jgi:uncharacterized protein YuzE
LQYFNESSDSEAAYIVIYSNEILEFSENEEELELKIA